MSRWQDRLRSRVPIIVRGHKDSVIIRLVEHARTWWLGVHHVTRLLWLPLMSARAGTGIAMHSMSVLTVQTAEPEGAECALYTRCRRGSSTLWTSCDQEHIVVEYHVEEYTVIDTSACHDLWLAASARVTHDEDRFTSFQPPIVPAITLLLSAAQPGRQLLYLILGYILSLRSAPATNP